MIYLKKVFIFFIALVKKCIKNEIIISSNELTYKLLLAFFPFIIFLMTILGFLNIDSDLILEHVKDTMPQEVVNIIVIFIYEVIDRRNTTLLTISLFITLFSASSGFYVFIRCINRIYDSKETRNFFVVRGISVCLVFLFAIGIIFSAGVTIFSSSLVNYLSIIFSVEIFNSYMISFSVILSSILILFFTISLIYKIACSKKIPYRRFLPGSAATIVFWVVSSKIFIIYVNNFAKYSSVYGSIAGIFILIFWLNLTSVILLVGAEINVLLNKEYNKCIKK